MAIRQLPDPGPNLHKSVSLMNVRSQKRRAKHHEWQLDLVVVGTIISSGGNGDDYHPRRYTIKL
jgi:hypothetical protein